jgi:hypothetical protein
MTATVPSATYAASTSLSLSAMLRIYSVDLSDSFFHNASVGNVYMAIYFARRILWKVWPTLVRILFAPLLLNPPAA